MMDDTLNDTLKSEIDVYIHYWTRYPVEFVFNFFLNGEVDRTHIIGAGKNLVCVWLVDRTKMSNLIISEKDYHMIRSLLRDYRINSIFK